MKKKVNADSSRPKTDSTDNPADTDARSENNIAAATAPENVPHNDTAEVASEPVIAATVVSSAVGGTTPKRSWRHKLLSHKKLTIPLAIVIVLVLLYIVPQTRYGILGMFWKQTYIVQVLDDQTNQPVSAATVSADGLSAMTDNQGRAHLRLKVGHKHLSVVKRYYRTTTKVVLIPLRKSGLQTFKLTATGRQVPIKIINRISGKPVADAVVKAAGTEIHTDKNGAATIVLPADKPSLDATLTAAGYNTLTSSVQVTTQLISANTFQLVPAGKVYFLSDLSGKIDVVKTNLDGSDRQTVVAGTGFEDSRATVLLASRDWKYLVLSSIRTDGGNPELNLIDTTNGDKFTNIDEGNASFGLVGWQGDYLVYTVSRNTVPQWQPNGESLKSYNAQTGKLTVLDNTSASGSSDNDAEYEVYGYNPAEIGSQILFYKNWWSYPGYINAAGKQNTLISINADGTNKKVISTLDAGTNFFGTVAQYKPQQLEIQVSSNQGGNDSYYSYQPTSGYTLDSDVDADNDINQSYPTYLLSPSGSQTFWSTPEDGKNGLYVGDQAGANKTEIASLSDYSAYGWYSDNYLLVSQNDSELYIMPASGGPALKITDYHKPVQSFVGYGGGYGGL